MREMSAGNVSRRVVLQRAARGSIALGATAWAAPAVLETAPATAVGSLPPGEAQPGVASATTSTPSGEEAAGEARAVEVKVLGDSLGATLDEDRPPARGGRLPTTGAELDDVARVGALALAAGTGLLAWHRAMGTGARPAADPPAPGAAVGAFVRAHGALWRHTGGGRVVVLPDSGPPLVLSGSAAQLWHLLSEPAGVDEAAAVLAEVCGREREQVRSHIGPIFERLQSLGLVERAAGSR